MSARRRRPPPAPAPPRCVRAGPTAPRPLRPLQQRQPEVEHGALALLALDLDGGAVRVQDALHDGQAQADAAEAARGGAVHLVEAVEDLADLVARDADAAVADADLGRRAARRPPPGRPRP